MKLIDYIKLLFLSIYNLSKTVKLQPSKKYVIANFEQFTLKNAQT